MAASAEPGARGVAVFADHAVGRQEFHHPSIRRIGRFAGDRTDLVKGIRVQKSCNALPHRETALLMLALNAFSAAQLLCQRLSARQFVDFGLPAQDLFTFMNDVPMGVAVDKKKLFLY